MSRLRANADYVAWAVGPVARSAMRFALNLAAATAIIGPACLALILLGRR